MECIIITTDSFWEGEATVLNSLFHAGMTCLHLRKPSSSQEDLQQLLQQTDAAHHSKIVLHDHFELLQHFSLGGVHLNSRNSACQQGITVASRTCHSLACLNAQQFTFNGLIFLSPIFDSISKAGYKKAFTNEELLEAKKNGLINRRTIALGGISADTIPVAASFGFGGVAVLGALWGCAPTVGDENKMVDRFLQLQRITDNL